MEKKNPKYISVQGHRGARGIYSENTLAAFAYAIEVGADFLELDLLVTKDKKVVIAHDPFLNQSLYLDASGNKIQKKIPIYELTLSELQKYDCGTIRNSNFPKQQTVPKAKIPTLDELFSMVHKMQLPQAKKILFNLEVKSIPAGENKLHPNAKDFARLVLAVVEKYKMKNRVLIQSFDHNILQESKRKNSKVRTSALFAENHINFSLVAKKIGVQYVAPNQYWITKKDIQELHKQKIKVAPWTVNEEDDWARLITAGVDSIITDYPAELLQYLRKRNLHK